MSVPGLVWMLGLGPTYAESWKYFLPYILLVKADYGPDHNIKHISNFLQMVALFILGGMGRLVAIRGCPGLFFQNTTERAVSLLNLGLSNLSFKIDEDAPYWIIDLLNGVSKMNVVQDEIESYNKNFLKAVKYSERTNQHSEPMTRNDNAESGANVLSDTTLYVVVSNNNETTTDTDSQD